MKNFYRNFLKLCSMLVLQNVVTLSVNLADNIMLGAFSETALSGVTTVNQVQFVFQQLLMALGDGLVIFGSQYWGKKETEPVRKIGAWAMRTGFFLPLCCLSWPVFFQHSCWDFLQQTRRLSKPVFPIWRSSGLLTFSLQ